VRDAFGRLAPGSILNPSGIGGSSKNVLSHQFLEDLREIWNEGGREALRKVMKKDPRSIILVVAGLVPKEMIVDETQRIYIIRDTPLTAEEWHAKHAGAVPIPDLN
jgi:hypothetical protein